MKAPLSPTYRAHLAELAARDALHQAAAAYDAGQTIPEALLKILLRPERYPRTPQPQNQTHQHQ